MNKVSVSVLLGGKFKMNLLALVLEKLIRCQHRNKFQGTSDRLVRFGFENIYSIDRKMDIKTVSYFRHHRKL